MGVLKETVLKLEESKQKWIKKRIVIMDNNKINVDVLEKNYNDFHYERTIFESVTYDTFKTSYFRSCDDELVEQMATKLNDCYSAIERNYNSTVEWWKNYLYDVKCAENGICMDSNTIPTHEKLY